MKILLLGAAGQVGFELHRSLAPLGEVVSVTRDGRLPGGGQAQSVDLTDVEAVEQLLKAQQPDVIVNAAAYTAVDRAESEPDLARQVNAELPGWLAHWGARNGAKLLHYSTDYVFDGNATQPWQEDQETSPLGVYGQSKRDGERAIIESGCQHLVLRTAWVYAARGHNFLRTMLRLAAERDQLRVVDDQIGTPTPARWISSATAAIVMREKMGANWQPGIVHLTARGQTSWYGFAQAIFAAAVTCGVLERAPQVMPISTQEYPTPAQRPAYSCLDTQRLKEWFGIQLPDWHEGLLQVMGEWQAP